MLSGVSLKGVIEVNLDKGHGRGQLIVSNVTSGTKFLQGSGSQRGVSKTSNHCPGQGH